jgi:hypothetical protein
MTTYRAWVASGLTLDVTRMEYGSLRYRREQLRVLGDWVIDHLTFAVHSPCYRGLLCAVFWHGVLTVYQSFWPSACCIGLFL